MFPQALQCHEVRAPSIVGGLEVQLSRDHEKNTKSFPYQLVFKMNMPNINEVCIVIIVMLYVHQAESSFFTFHQVVLAKSILIVLEACTIHLLGGTMCTSYIILLVCWRCKENNQLLPFSGLCFLYL